MIEMKDRIVPDRADRTNDCKQRGAKSPTATQAGALCSAYGRPCTSFRSPSLPTMMRTESTSVSPTTSPWKDAPTPAVRPKTLLKTASLADLRESVIGKPKRWLRKRSTTANMADFDFGCAGDLVVEDEEERSESPDDELDERGLVSLVSARRSFSGGASIPRLAEV